MKEKEIKKKVEEIIFMKIKKDIKEIISKKDKYGGRVSRKDIDDYFKKILGEEKIKGKKVD